MEISQLKFYSYGIVLTDLVRGEEKIKVLPMEFRLGTRTKIKDEEATEELEYETRDGEEAVSMTSGSAVTARWLKFNTNRITPPDVKREEQVLIYRKGDTDIYYWQDFNISNVKRLETVVYAFSADPDNKIADDLSNAYMFMVSTHDKHITLQTSTANGEPFAYTLQLDTDEGNFKLTDDIGNVVYLDSANETVGIENSAGSWYKIHGPDMSGHAPAKMTFSAGESLTLTTPLVQYNVDDMKLTGSMSIGDGIDVTGNGVVSGDVTVKGKVTILKDLLVKGKGKILGMFSHPFPPCC